MRFNNVYVQQGRGGQQITLQFLVENDLPPETVSISTMLLVGERKDTVVRKLKDLAVALDGIGKE